MFWWKRVHNLHRRISSLQGNRRMAPPEASPCPLWSLAIGLPSIDLASAVRCLYLKLGSGFRGPLHILWTQQEQPPQNMEFVPTPFRHAAHRGSMPDSRSTSNPGSAIRTLVLHLLARSPFPYMLVTQGISFSCSSSGDSVVMTRSSVYRFTQVHPVRNSWERTFRTLMHCRGLSLGWHPLLHWTLQSGCSQHALCFWHFHTCSVWATPATPQCQSFRVKGPWGLLV